jgi:hypothetical protein
MSPHSRNPGLRQLMLAVALTAIALAGSRIYTRWSFCQRQAALHAVIERDCRVGLADLEALAKDPKFAFLRDAEAGTIASDDGQLLCIGSISQAQESLDRHSRLRRLYASAAWWPWTALPSDPECSRAGN